MKTKNKKTTQIIFGILTAFALWISAILLSGQLPLGENIELYHTGPLVIIFPFVFLAFCIFIAKYSANKKLPAYFKTSIVCFIIPFIAWILSLLLNSVAQETTPVFSYIANFNIYCSVDFSIYPINITYTHKHRWFNSYINKHSILYSYGCWYFDFINHL